MSIQPPTAIHTLDAAAVTSLKADLRGEVVVPGDASYDAVRAVWNGMIDEYPAVIARCGGAADVIAAIRFAREHDLVVAVRGGGHSTAGPALCDGGLVIDLSPMKSIRVDPARRTVRAEPGVRLGELLRETQAFGLATTTGTVSDTGVDALQRRYGLREVFNGLRWLIRSGAQWRMLPRDFPRWEAVYQQTQRWLRAGCFEAIADDLRLLLRLAAGRSGQPSAVILDARTVQSTPESGAGAGYDGHKRRKGRKVHLAVDTLGHLLATVITPANEQERAQVAKLAALVQQVTGQTVE